MTTEGRRTKLDPMTRSVGRYEILGDLAFGGMAEILLGRLLGPSGFERVVVIKRILPHLAKQKAFVDMFLDEARTMARIRHPNVVHVHELGTQDDELFLVMEYLEGESAAGLLRRLRLLEEDLDPYLAAFLVAEVCRGLHAAHELTDPEGLPLDLVHRDVSPQNVFVTYAGSMKVLDFGIARVADQSTRTEAGQVKGKYAYMSPEQCAAKNLDRRSDLFSLGAVLFELLTGSQLFKRENELETLRAVCEDEIPAPSSIKPGVPAALDRIVARALERSRSQRYNTAAELRADLAVVLRESPVDHEEMLGALMKRIFADRIEEKLEMLRHARAGSSVSRVPQAEVDEAVELPPAKSPGSAADESTATKTASVVHAHERQKPRVRWPWALGGGIALGLAFGGFRMLSRSPSDAPGTASTVDVPTSVVVPPTASASTSSVPSAALSGGVAAPSSVVSASSSARSSPPLRTGRVPTKIATPIPTIEKLP